MTLRFILHFTLVILMGAPALRVAGATATDRQTVPAAGAVPVPVRPLSADGSRQKIRLPAGYRVELVAAEPLLLEPVAFDWDERGRMWVVEMADYPLGMDGNGQAGGRIRILEGVNGDGNYDRSRVFAEGLSFPTGILTWRDGCLLTAAPDTLLFRDTHGACHHLESTGMAVGPDLRSIVDHPAEKLLNSLLDPSADIEPGCAAYFGELTMASRSTAQLPLKRGQSFVPDRRWQHACGRPQRHQDAPEFECHAHARGAR